MQISFILTIVRTYLCIVLAVAFFTLLERKVLSYMQTRKGPNKISLVGMSQPITDAIKLLMKEQLEPNSANFFLYFLAPCLSFLIILLN